MPIWILADRSLATPCPCYGSAHTNGHQKCYDKWTNRGVNDILYNSA
jgi:hypothetical protein